MSDSVIQTSQRRGNAVLTDSLHLHLLLLHFHLLQLFPSEIHKTYFKNCSWLIVQLFLLLIVYKMALIPKQLMPNFKSGHGKVTTANLLIWFLEIRQFFKI